MRISSSGIRASPSSRGWCCRGGSRRATSGRRCSPRWPKRSASTPRRRGARSPRRRGRRCCTARRARSSDSEATASEAGNAPTTKPSGRGSSRTSSAATTNRRARRRASSSRSSWSRCRARRATAAGSSRRASRCCSRAGASAMWWISRWTRRWRSSRAFRWDAVLRVRWTPTSPGNVFRVGGDGERGGKRADYETEWEGILKNVERRYNESSSEAARQQLEEFLVEMPCKACNGRRLKPESLAVLLAGRSIGDVVDLPVDEALAFFEGIPVGRGTAGAVDPDIAGPILKEVRDRLAFLRDVGLEYLTLGRSAGSLSGGEAQRIRLATQIGSRLVGVLYVLDEPSIGLHQRDNARLLGTLRELRDLGNTVIVVEHDEDTIRAADHVIDLGPRAGNQGGQVVAEGTVDGILAHSDSLTARYLRGELRIPVPGGRRARDPKRVLRVVGARANNLRSLTVEIPLKLFVAVTGVSGSGEFRSEERRVG